MKQKLKISLICFAAVAVLILIFPFRTAVFGDLSASLGPYFIFSNPSKASIYEAVFNKPKQTYLESKLQSEIDYGRTFLLFLPFAAGAVASQIWMRNLQE